jgi:predicted glutamine amidotransferase
VFSCAKCLIDKKVRHPPEPMQVPGGLVGAAPLPGRPSKRNTEVRMCRWIAYRGQTAAFERYVTEPVHSLIAQSLRARESSGSTNGDGFGLGWYGIHPEPGLYRETRPAWSDENLSYLCRHLQSHLFFAHVRAATGTAVTRQNCHPFACGRWMFMHNGFVGSWNRLRRKVEGMIPDELYPSRVGTTDSEAVFLAMMGAGLAENPLEATRRVLRELCSLVNTEGLRERLRFTSALTNGHDLFAFRFAENDTANSLYFRKSGDALVVVSEPFDRESGWQEVPTNHVLIASGSGSIDVVPFLRAEPSRPAQERLPSQKVVRLQ